MYANYLTVMREKGKFFWNKRKKKFAKRQSRGIKRRRRKKRQRIFNSLSFVVKDNEALWNMRGRENYSLLFYCIVNVDRYLYYGAVLLFKQKFKWDYFECIFYFNLFIFFFQHLFYEGRWGYVSNMQVLCH